jgi:hypothetical protein
MKHPVQGNPLFVIQFPLVRRLLIATPPLVFLTLQYCLQLALKLLASCRSTIQGFAKIRQSINVLMSRRCGHYANS